MKYDKDHGSMVVDEMLKMKGGNSKRGSKIPAMKYNTFNLEEEIQNVWQTKDDLDAITERMYDDPGGPMTEDEIGNVLIGLSELHETRCKKLWKVFETMINEKKFKDVYYESNT